jgi:NAD(P)-dependent dehydrogenase (short-subunit alcohol dehydrogenase family)
MNNNPLFSLDKKVIIVTGGGGFLGRQYAQALAEAGAIVVVWDKNPQKLAEMSALITNAGGSVHAESIDITDEEQVKGAVEKVQKEFGHIDGLINNAAMAAPVGDPDADKQFVPYEEYPLELWKKELEVNLNGTMLCTKYVARVMMAQKSGSIVNIASEVSVIAHDHRVYNDPANKRFKSIAYTTTKTAVVGFTRQWAARLGAYNVRVNAFSPGGIQTPAHPKDFVERFGGANMLGRMARIGEYNGIVVFLCSDASSFMTGHNLVADGGKSAW